jgi:hypothetical protein
VALTHCQAGTGSQPCSQGPVFIVVAVFLTGGKILEVKIG